MTTSPYNPAPVFVIPPKTPVRVHPVLAGVIALVALVLGVGFGSANAKPTAAVPAPTVSVTSTVTATATATVTAEPTVSSNVQRLQTAWSGLDATSKASIRSAWKSAKGIPSSETVVITSLMNALLENAPTLTAAETREFLDWTLTH
jgi:hypothetical protein